MKDFVESCRLGALSQGLVFNGAQAEDYESCPVFGLIITARCDIAHDKARTYNYLPIVRLSDWLNRDGRLIFCERASAEVRGSMKSLLLQAGFSPEILRTEAPVAILEKLMPPDGGRKLSKAREQFAVLVDRADSLARVYGDSPSASELIKLMTEAFPKVRDSLIKELCSQQLTGYYFMPRIDVTSDDSGFVILLREIRHMPRRLALQLVQGLSDVEYATLGMHDALLAGRLVFVGADFVMPLSQVTSPRLEHILQQFSMLFGRIGVTDVEESYRLAIWGRLFPGE